MIQNQMSSDFILKINIKIVILTLVAILLLHCKDAIANALSVSNAVQPSKYFTARETELKKIKNYLIKGEGMASIVGVAGIGKTQLVRKYVDLNKDKYKIIWFFNCKRNLISQFQELAKQINTRFNSLNSKISENPELVVGSLLAYLSVNQDWILMIDNYRADLEDKVVEFLNEIPRGRNKHLIFISRKNEGLNNPILLKPFARKDSITLISSILGRGVTYSGAENALAELLMDYPLALSKVSSFLNKHPFITFDDLKNIFAKGEVARNLIFEDDQSDYFNDGQTIEKMIIHYINSLDNASVKLLTYSALLDNANLNKSFLEVLFIGDSTNKLKKKQEFLSALLILNQNSLIEYKQGGMMGELREIADENFEMHDFLQKEIINCTKGNLLEAELRELISKLNKLLPEDMSEIGLLQTRFSALVENLEALFENAVALNISIAEQLCIKKHLLLLYFYNNDYKKVKSCLAWFEKSLSTLDLSEKNLRILVAQFYLFSGQYNDFINSDYELAIKDYDKGLELLTGLEDEKYEIVYTLYTVKAQTMFEYGQLGEALDILSKAEVIIKKFPNIHNAGLFYFVKAYIALGAGDLKSASESMRLLLEVEGHLPKNVFTAPTYFLQAEILSKNQAPKDAYVLMSDLLTLLAAQEEENYQIKPLILRELARAELVLGKMKRARIHIDLAIQSLMEYNILFIKKEDIENYNDELATLYHVKADIALAEKKYAEALDLYQKSIAIFEKRYRAIEVDSMSELYSKAAEVSFKLQNQFLFKFYIQRQEKHFGINHHRTKALYELML